MDYRTVNQTELDVILYRHYKWIRDMPGGERADLSDADLSRANLSDANLSDAKEDIFSILDAAPAEVPALLETLRAGGVNGTCYEGDCACLAGTIANIRGEHYTDLNGIVPNGARPAERWFLAIHEGDKPDNHPVAKITAEWIEEWLANQAKKDADSEAEPAE